MKSLKAVYGNRKQTPPTTSNNTTRAVLPQTQRVKQPVQQGSFSCDACNKHFKTQSMLDGHLKQHVKCGVGGCEYSAVPGMMREHKLVHSKRVQKWMQMTEQEIAEWREERKKNWPTEANIARKKREREEKKEAEVAVKEANSGEQEKVKSKKKKQKSKGSKTGAKEEKEKKTNVIVKQKRKTYLLNNLFEKERQTECDLLLQCFEYMEQKEKK